ncbi:hypothetical protein [Streptomyces sp.]|uniref:hypothetical protein n=1 Tax=Streptomyces sp. TaxID=1931 RepID=UPI0025ECAD22|nr:hypothetical protein [Streptomyces sp.]
MTEAVRALLEHLATAAPQILDELVTADWSQRYGRQVRMCSQPSHPVARLTQVGADADVLLERVYAPLRRAGAAASRRAASAADPALLDRRAWQVPAPRRARRPAAVSDPHPIAV